jgi:hypothetical protein
MKRSMSLLIFVVVSYSCQKEFRHADEDLLNEKIQEINFVFKNGSKEDFNNLHPDESVRQLLHDIIDEKIKREIGQHKILKIDADSAYVLLTGKFTFGNSGDETNYSSDYSGVYLFTKNDYQWTINQRIDIGKLNQIVQHDMNIEVNPGETLNVKDVLTLNIKSHIGFFARLNHKAQITSLLFNDQEVEYIFDGGLLWVDAKPGEGQKLLLDYSIEVEQDETDRNSGFFGKTYGHVRNQYFWHPFFDFASPNDRAHFNVNCKIPVSYHLTTSLPQSDSVEGRYRIVKASSPNPTFGLSLYYDKDWYVREIKKGEMNLVLYTNTAFTPTDETLYEEFSYTFDILANEFGTPRINYLGVVQDRSSGGNGWKSRSNNIIISGENGSFLKNLGPHPRAIFGHEVAHSWVNPAGAATNFLSEGWATYAESVILSKEKEETIISNFFESQKENYLNSGFDGTSSLWSDYSNSGVSYSKGAWLFYMLEKQLGQQSFRKALHDFIQSKNHNIYSFIKHINEASEKDIRPLVEIWLKSKEIPDLSIFFQENTLTIEQSGDVFVFPLEILFTSRDGKSFMKEVSIYKKKHIVVLNEFEPINCTIDPNQKLLLKIKH